MNSFKSLLLLILPLLSLCFADEVQLSEKKNKEISILYTAGPYLLYQCEDHHFACISDFSYGECAARREAAIRRKNLNLPCAPLKKFEDTESCLQWLYREIHKPRNLKNLCRLNAFKH